MNWKRFLVAFVVVLVVTAAANFVIHGSLLHEDYARYPNLLRPEADANAHAPFLLLAFAAFALGFTLIWGLWMPPYSSPVRAGVFYGAVVWLIASVSRYFVYYAVQPWGMEVIRRQIGYELVWLVVTGAVLGLVYRKA